MARNIVEANSLKISDNESYLATHGSEFRAGFLLKQISPGCLGWSTLWFRFLPSRMLENPQHRIERAIAKHTLIVACFLLGDRIDSV